MARPAVPIEQRFWTKVDKTDESGCWIWTGSLRGPGYGVAFMDGRRQDAHRVSWVIAHGPIPDGMCVLHTCDTPRCVNPAHLVLGTHKDNTQDMIRKGRNKIGIPGKQTVTKLTPEQVDQIRSMLNDGASQRFVAQCFSVSSATISYIANRKTWNSR